MEVSDVLTAARNPVRAGAYLARYPAVSITSRIDVGTNVFSRDWDVLVILDTCRVDAMRQVADEFDFLGSIDRILSPGGATPEWVAETFVPEYADTIERTAYVVRNGWAHRVLDQRRHPQDKMGAPRILANYDFLSGDDVGHVEHVWRYYESELGDAADDGELERRDARYVTDAAIRAVRGGEFDRYIVHYSRPHVPYVANALREDRSLREYERDPFGYQKRTGDRETVFEAYLDDLRYVLEEVDLLLRSVDADRVVISADHGDAFGEYDVYGHWVGSVHPQVRYVPWVETTARDTSGYEPREYDRDDRDVKESLRALGYKV